MLENHITTIENLIKWYLEVKNVILKIENENEKIYIQAYNELRYSYDHFIRAINWELSKKTTFTQDQISNIDCSIEKAINSSVNHLQRAYSDICEWYFLKVKEICIQTLSPYTTEQISKALPNYYSSIKPKLEEIGKYLTIYKENKSSENNNLSDENVDSLLFSKQIEDLSNILSQIKNSEISLIEIKYKDKKNKFLTKFLLPISTAVASGLIVYIATAILE